MVDNSFFSYLAGAISYFGLFLWALWTLNRQTLQPPVLIAVFFSLLWMGVTAFVIYSENFYVFDSLPFETLRGAAWYFLLAIFLSRQRYGNSYSLFIDSGMAKIFMVFLGFIFIFEVSAEFRDWVKQAIGVHTQIRLFAHLVMAISGLVLIEQLYRNADSDQRWSFKWLCLALGCLFTVDFFLYSKSMLFLRLDSELWGARGVINALITPLLAAGISRLQTQSFSAIAISRKVVFHTTAMLGAGLYLILMSLVGFYIRDFGGSWGGVIQIAFTVLALVLLLALFFSGRIRAYFKFFISKHFFRYHYDYRNEWIKLSNQIAGLHSFSELPGFIIDTFTNMVDCSGGGIWINNGQGGYYLSEHKNLGFQPPRLVDGQHPSISFLKASGWVLDFVEYKEDPEIYADTDLSLWSNGKNKVWVIVPLFFRRELEAIVILSQAKVQRKLNWEDRDLLKTVGLQLVNALALSKTSDDLAKSRQFEAYSRISAYLVHDLKNLVAQIALIVKNAEKHKRNPEFIDDSIETLQNVVVKIDQILGHLKKGSNANAQPVLMGLLDVLHDVSVQQSANKPVPEVVCIGNDIKIVGEKQKLVAIFGHLVQNAQEATPDDGFVRLELSKHEGYAVIKVADNGCGMDDKFIAERLFRPFDTTKGNAGMGIGVYEAREYILSQGGNCRVESQPGEGTCFIVSLPFAS